MGEVLPLPHRGETFLDPRGESRSIRISGHPDAGTVVLSMWQHGQCRATFRLPGSEVDAFIRALLAAAPPAAPAVTSQSAEPDIPDAETPETGAFDLRTSARPAQAPGPDRPAPAGPHEPGLESPRIQPPRIQPPGLESFG